MLALALLGPGTEAAELAGKSGLSVMESSLLGAIAILSLVVAIFSVWKLNRVQNERVADQKQLSERMEKASERQEKLVEKMTGTFAGVKNALDNLTQTEKDTQFVLRDLKSSMDGVIRDAVNRRIPSAPAPRG
jgi:uncharacterized membrane-anchored protein YhcB (DUF1043 family)